MKARIFNAAFLTVLFESIGQRLTKESQSEMFSILHLLQCYYACRHEDFLGYCKYMISFEVGGEKV